MNPNKYLIMGHFKVLLYHFAHEHEHKLDGIGFVPCNDLLLTLVLFFVIMKINEILQFLDGAVAFRYRKTRLFSRRFLATMFEDSRTVRIEKLAPFCSQKTAHPNHNKQPNSLIMKKKLTIILAATNLVSTISTFISG
jgi:hypothetical protein